MVEKNGRLHQSSTYIYKTLGPGGFETREKVQDDRDLEPDAPILFSFDNARAVQWIAKTVKDLLRDPEYRRGFEEWYFKTYGEKYVWQPPPQREESETEKKVRKYLDEYRERFRP